MMTNAATGACTLMDAGYPKVRKCGVSIGRRAAESECVPRPWGAAHLNQVPSFVYFPVYCIACLFVWVFSFGPPSQHFPVVCVRSSVTSPLCSGHRTSLKGTSDSHCLEPRPVWASAISGAASCTSSARFNWKMLFSTLYSKWLGLLIILMLFPPPWSISVKKKKQVKKKAVVCCFLSWNLFWMPASSCLDIFRLTSRHVPLWFLIFLIAFLTLTCDITQVCLFNTRQVTERFF